MSETTNLKMQLPDGTDWADVETLNQNFQKVDAAMPGANVKETPADTDKVLLYDSEDKALVGKPKKVLLSKLIELWENTFCTKDELSSSLLEKVSVPIEIAANSDLNNFRNCGFYFCGNGGETISNKPGTSDAFGAFSLLVQKTGSWGGNGVNQILTDYTIRPLMHTDIRHAVPAEIDFAVALAVDDLAVDILSLSTAVVAIDFSHGCHASLYLAICSGVSVSMPTSWHSEMIPSKKTLISFVEYSLVPLIAR